MQDDQSVEVATIGNEGMVGPPVFSQPRRPFGVFGKIPTSKRVQEVGWHCYQVEEHLSKLELQELKHGLEINEVQWRTYKAEVSAKLHSNLLTRIRFFFTEIRNEVLYGRKPSSVLPITCSWLASLRP
jgi:hypothetical protein